jgi:hypothetical protein
MLRFCRERADRQYCRRNDTDKFLHDPPGSLFELEFSARVFGVALSPTAQTARKLTLALYQCINVKQCISGAGGSPVMKRRACRHAADVLLLRPPIPG